MSAEVLRKAAAAMRYRAERIPVGPWEKEFSDVIRTDVPLGAKDYMIAETETVERAAHIASWHPAVALAVADWLDYAASVWMGFAPPEQTRLLTVANAYLGSDS